jgi:hypothetical protein
VIPDKRAASRLPALLLLGMMAGVLADVVHPWEGLRWAARLLLVTYLVVEWRGMAANAKVMIGLALAMTAGAAAMGTADPGRVVTSSLDNGAFFATFFANQFFLKEAARSSPLVGRCSAFFVNQKPGRRYALLTLGGYLFGVILSIGVLSLLGIMIKQRNTLETAGGVEAVRDARERRMVLALLRGFSVTPLSSPLSISLAVMMTALPDLHWSTLLPLGILTGAIVLVLGWGLDRLTAPVHLRGLAPPVEAANDFGALAGVTGLVLLVFVAALAMEAALGVPMSRAMLVSTPLVGIAWLLRQYLGAGLVKGSAAAARRVVTEAAATFPLYRTEIGILSSAGFIGTLFTAMVPPEALGALITSPLLPPLALPTLAILSVAGPALFGVNPIVSATIIASALRATPNLPLPSEALALSLIGGWCLAINSSPLTASAMLMGDLVGRPSKAVVLGWNGKFALVVFAALALWLTALAYLQA